MGKRETEEKEKVFLREFKLLMMEGFIFRKRCTYYGSVFRKYWIVPDEERIYWNSRKIKKSPNYISYAEIISIHKNVNINDSYSKEYISRFFVIEIILNNMSLDSFYGKSVINKKSIILECADELTRDLMVDGFCLLWEEYKEKEQEKKIKVKVK
jgi:hypothetical protein